MSFTVYTPEEAKQWVQYGSLYNNPLRVLTYRPETPKGKGLIHEIVADVPSKLFTHNVDRFMEGVIKQIEKAPALKPLMDGFEFHFCPNPAMEFQNASCCGGEAIVLWGRTTQTLGHLTDYLVSHELGHTLQIKLASKWKDDTHSLFRRYLELRNAPRGLCKVTVEDGVDKLGKTVWSEVEQEDFLYLNGTQKDKDPDWDLSPQEWFAEDFRFIMGVEKNPEWLLTTIPEPDNRVREFIQTLSSI